MKETKGCIKRDGGVILLIPVTSREGKKQTPRDVRRGKHVVGVYLRYALHHRASKASASRGLTVFLISVSALASRRSLAMLVRLLMEAFISAVNPFCKTQDRRKGAWKTRRLKRRKSNKKENQNKMSCCSGSGE
jgi:hypothetical protein